MKDFLGNDLEVGDSVACIELGYKNLIKTVVVKITEKTIFVENPKGILKDTIKRYPDQVIKIG